jgi:hypothetical protein
MVKLPNNTAARPSVTTMFTSVADANNATGRQPASRRPLRLNSRPIETNAKIAKIAKIAKTRNQVRSTQNCPMVGRAASSVSIPRSLRSCPPERLSTYSAK